jgi:predicted N-formylglutamate amidohydrolase
VTILAATDRAAALVENERGASAILLLGDHAGRAIPAALGDLGVSALDLERHIAWDIGVSGLGAVLSRTLDATFIHQRYSRLVIDCNRALSSRGSIVEISDGVAIPGNSGLTLADRRARIANIYLPYHDRIASELTERKARGARTILVSLHSFTPVMDGEARPWRLGVLHRNDSQFSLKVLGALRQELGDEVGDNEPYAMDGIDYTIPFHADAHGLEYVEVEVRQDLIASAEGEQTIGALLARVLAQAMPV